MSTEFHLVQGRYSPLFSSCDHGSKIFYYMGGGGISCPGKRLLYFGKVLCTVECKYTLGHMQCQMILCCMLVHFTFRYPVVRSLKAAA